jgi:hypothetical protein
MDVNQAKRDVVSECEAASHSLPSHSAIVIVR